MSGPVILDAEALDRLIGRSVISWGREDTLTHFLLDDGRVLIFDGNLCILEVEEHAIH